jgi:hypothetical protein
MIACQTLRLSVGALAVVLACAPGCAGSAHGGAGSTSPEVAEAAPADLAADSAIECRAEATTAGEEVLLESGGVPVSEAELDVQAAPAPSRAPAGGGAPASPTARSPGDAIGDAYAMQGAGLGALGCALDASDCASAAQLGDEICRLAERVCDLAPDDPRCDEARSRCERARARVSASCGER